MGLFKKARSLDEQQKFTEKIMAEIPRNGVTKKQLQQMISADGPTPYDPLPGQNEDDGSGKMGAVYCARCDGYFLPHTH